MNLTNTSMGTYTFSVDEHVTDFYTSQKKSHIWMFHADITKSFMFSQQNFSQFGDKTGRVLE